MDDKNPKPQTHKSVAFHTLAFCPWHSDRIPHTLACEKLTTSAQWLVIHFNTCSRMDNKLRSLQCEYIKL